MPSHWCGHQRHLLRTCLRRGCAVGASRLIYALSRDGAGPRALDFISSVHKIPSRAVALVVVIGWAFFIVGVVPKLGVFDAAAIAGTAGTLLLLVAYFMACLGCMRLLRGGIVVVAKWEIFIPLAAMVVLAYTMLRNIWPLPKGAALWGPGLFVLVAAGIAAFVLARPEAMRRAGKHLTMEEGLAPATENILT